MRVKRRASALASWMAMLAMLMAILAPALSHAFAGDATAAYLSADICRAGSAAAAADAAAPGSHEGKPKHCPYCHHGNGMLLLPPAPRALALAVADAPPAAQLPAAPKARSAWTPAQARGPPLA
ncbi:DUF2946 family protein [Massilia aquatica]|uniref:DUF2946 domain-containing protein n=1 Tax=Massilia aquatica TaxID=2609000 RepID=A0ABX0M950_9BURK|nr:DUF2946 family protein [Massilia aquatica]NHZ41545.1 DUF2946 domain-containing protein [Massilia aquatica]